MFTYGLADAPSAIKLERTLYLGRVKDQLMSKFLRYRKTGHIVTLTMNEPDLMNALSAGTICRLRKYCARINQDYDVRCVILTGAGKAFSAGGNVKAMQERNRKGQPPRWLSAIGIRTASSAFRWHSITWKSRPSRREWCRNRRRLRPHLHGGHPDCIDLRAFCGDLREDRHLAW